MSNIDRAGKDRTGLFGSITNCDDVVEGLSDKLLEMLRSMVANIYADFIHGFYRHRIETGWMGPSTCGLEVVTSNQAE
jgi:hypothetical protein